jgi:hypothetical protein
MLAVSEADAYLPSYSHALRLETELFLVDAVLANFGDVFDAKGQFEVGSRLGDPDKFAETLNHPDRTGLDGKKDRVADHQRSDDNDNQQ